MNRLPKVGSCAPKQRWKLVTDQADRDSLKALGKYREHLVFWRIDGDQMWVLADDFREWKETGRVGKRLCQNTKGTEHE